MANPLLESALRYLELGFSVIPIIPGQKKPMVKWETFQKQKATKTQVVSWWSATPNANVGIITGEISNLFVVDIDTDEGHQNLLEYGFDTIVTPTVKTPRGGQHLYFQYPQGTNITIGAGKIRGTDFRGNGGYVVAPPSVNGDGTSYEWLPELDLAIVNLYTLPLLYIKKLFTPPHAYVTGQGEKQLQTVTSVTNCDNDNLWEHGKRDENLFHVAWSLAKSGNDKEYIFHTLRAIMASWGEYDERWIRDKIESAFKRKEGKERNLHAEVGEFIAVTSGDFSVTSCYLMLQVVTKECKGTIRQSFKRYAEQGVIEKVGTKDGVYRRVEKDLAFIDFSEPDEEENEFIVKMPFNLGEIVDIFAGNIILIGGEYNAGKTTFLLNILRMNKNKVPLRYISSEMGKKEFKRRFRGFYGIAPDFWKNDAMTDYVKRSHSFSAVIRPKALNIIDYLEFPRGDYTQGAELLTQIHDKLEGGVAVVAIQKKEGTRLPRAGDLVMEKPRLVITLTKAGKDEDTTEGVAEILKAKFPKAGKLDGKRLKFEIVEYGSTFKVLRDWGYWRDWTEKKN